MELGRVIARQRMNNTQRSNSTERGVKDGKIGYTIPLNYLFTQFFRMYTMDIRKNSVNKQICVHVDKKIF